MATTTEVKPHIGKRTGIDFSKHEVIVTETDNFVSHFLKKPDTICDSIKFINTSGILAVTGDYGNWIFCRQFQPDAKTKVSDGYWREKLHMASCQEPMDYDEDGTRDMINEMLKEDISNVDRSYLEELLMYTENEIEYQYMAFLKLKTTLDSESIPIKKKAKYWLLAVFDGFDEICARLKQAEETKS